MLRMIGTLITRITRIFTDFTLFGFLINFVKANNKGTIFIQTKDTHKNCKTFGTKKIRENPPYPHHPRSYPT